MSITIQLNNKPFACKKRFIRNNPSMNEFLLNGSYIINIDELDIEPYHDLLTKIFLDQYYQISESDVSFLTQLNQKIKCIDLQIKIDKLLSKTGKNTDNIINHPDLAILIKLEETLLGLSESNFDASSIVIESMLQEKKINAVTLMRTIFGSIFPCIEKIDLYFDLVSKIDKNIKIKNEFCKNMVNFCEKSKGAFSREMCFLINKMVDRGLIEYNGFSKHNPYFMHFMKEEEINKLCRSKMSKSLYLPEIKGDGFQQHRTWCRQGKNEHKIAEFIRNDDLDQIKKSDIDFINYDHVPPSIYECHEIFGLRAKHAEYAALYGAEKCFDFFMEKIKYTSTNDKLARCAIIGGNNNIIKKCIKMNLMTQNCLETALIYHRNELFEWLLDQKNSYSIKPTFFLISIFHGCFKAIQIMIQNGASPSSFLYHSITHENINILHWNLLLDPDVNFKNGLMILNACERCKYNMIKLLARYPSSNFDCRDKFDGCTSLHIICKFSDDVRAVKLVMEKMKNETISSKQKDGLTALHIACSKGNIEIVKLLLNTGLFDIGELTNNGKSSLFYAAKCKHCDLVHYLLSAFSERIQSFIDKDTIQLCYDLYNVQIAELLYEITKVPPKKATLSAACEDNEIEFVNYLFMMKNKLNWELDCNNKDFIVACENGFTQIALTIINNDVEIFPNETINGKTSLHYACKNGMKEIVENLVKHDQIDLNLTTKKSRKLDFSEEDNDFSYDDEYEYNEQENVDKQKETLNKSSGNQAADEKIEEESKEKQIDINESKTANSTTTKKKSSQNKEEKKKERKERRQKLKEILKKPIVNLKDSIDQEIKSFIFNEDGNEDMIDKRKFEKFISEINMKRKGRSAISIACRKGYYDIVMILLQTERVDLNGINLLFDSIYSNNKDLIIYVLDYIEVHNKQMPNQMIQLTSEDETPLQFACRVSDNVEIFQFLYKHFPPTLNEEQFDSIYYKSFRSKNDEYFYASQAKVFDNNFDFDYYSNENLNNLFKIAIENRHPNIAQFIIDIIIKSNDISMLNDCLFTACKAPYKDIVRSIVHSPELKKIFEIESLEDVIYEICKKGRIENLKIMLKELELDIGNMIFHQTKSILHLASKSPNSEILEYIIQLNNGSIDINMNEADGDGYTALMLAAKKKNLRNTEILFYNNDVNRSIITHKQSIVSLCYRTGNICFVDLLRQVNSFNAKDENLVLHAISASGSVELLQSVIDNKAIPIDQSVKYLTKDGFNCFHRAILNGSIGIIDKFVKYGLFDINTRANDGRTPLQIAVDSRNFYTVEYLLIHKVSAINAPYPKKKQTVLHKAVKEKMFDIVCLLLLNKEIDLNSKDSKGRTPEEICNSSRIQQMFEIKKSGIDENEIAKKLHNLIDVIHKADQIKEKFNKFNKLNRKIRFDYHAAPFEFDEPDDSIRNLIYNSDNFDYRCDSSSSSDDDDEDYDEDMEEMDDEIVFVKKKKTKSKNKRSRGRYRNRKKFKKTQK